MIPAADATDPAPPASNVGEWTVGELAGRLKRTLEDAFGHVRLRGEISGYRGPHASGHAYFCLKDKDARLDAVVWKSAFGRLRFKPQEGLEVVVTGRITTFPGKSTYQIVIEQLEPAGVGALMALLDERRRRLTAEGIFAETLKRRPPFLPRIVGVVTSPTGSVIRDILHRLEDRFPRHVLVWPVRVQGETCAAEVAAAISGFNALVPDGRVPRPDVLIVARGGGSLEDLWGFNEEVVVRAAAASAIPLIAAIGHETDWTLIDHAADLRAPTPTGAAEMAVPVRTELIARMGGVGARHLAAAWRGLEIRRTELRSAVRALPGPEMLVGGRRQRLNLAAARLVPALLANARTHEARLGRAGALLQRHTPRAEIAAARARLAGLSAQPRAHLTREIVARRKRIGQLGESLRANRDRIVLTERDRLAQCRLKLDSLTGQVRRGFSIALATRRARVVAAGDLLLSVSYRSVLQRGYALVRGPDDVPVGRASELSTGDSVSIEFADGRRRALVEGVRPKRRAGPLVQASLFDM